MIKFIFFVLSDVAILLGLVWFIIVIMNSIVSMVSVW